MAENPGAAFAAATVIGTEGSAYRKKGAKMYFTSSGEAYGLISGGCLEEDLAARVPAIIRSNTSERLTYDMRSEDDLGWGKGAGCNGSIEVLLECVIIEEELTLMINELRSGKSVYAVRKTQSGKETDTFIFDQTFTRLGRASDGTDSDYARRLAKTAEETGEALLTESDTDVMWVAEALEPKAKLYVFGAGKDAEPVVQRAAELQFHVTVIDPNAVRCSRVYFPAAERLVCSRPERFFAEEKLEKDAYVIVMTHRFEEDAVILANLLAEMERFVYAGVLGPRRRTQRLLGDKAIPEKLSSPIGLDILADGADEISISILAELILARNKHTAARRQLSEMH